jgi:hypothetical protein
VVLIQGVIINSNPRRKRTAPTASPPPLLPFPVPLLPYLRLRKTLQYYTRYVTFRPESSRETSCRARTSKTSSDDLFNTSHELSMSPSMSR